MDVTREQLAKAVDGTEIVVDLTGGDVVPGTWAGAKIRYPSSFASAIFARLSENAPAAGAGESRPLFHGVTFAPADQEVAFLGAAVRALDEMGDLSVARVMAYLSDRYPADE
jgi:hypothetical protein